MAHFASMMTEDEVRFVAISYRELLDGWGQADNAEVRNHAEAIRHVFGF